MVVWLGTNLSPTIQTSVNFRNFACGVISSLAKDVSLSNLAILLILRRSF